MTTDLNKRIVSVDCKVIGGSKGGGEAILQPVRSGQGSKDGIAWRQSPREHEPPRGIGLWLIHGVDSCGGSRQRQQGGVDDDY